MIRVFAFEDFFDQFRAVRAFSVDSYEHRALADFVFIALRFVLGDAEAYKRTDQATTGCADCTTGEGSDDWTRNEQTRTGDDNGTDSGEASGDSTEDTTCNATYSSTSLRVILLLKYHTTSCTALVEGKS